MNLKDANGHWALVTGASSGIGREFCQQLAAAGMHLAIVARREQRLNELGKQLTNTHQVQTLVMPIDLSKPGAAAQVKSQLDHREIKVRLLCNNAAVGRWGRFENG